MQTATINVNAARRSGAAVIGRYMISHADVERRAGDTSPALPMPPAELSPAQSLQRETVDTADSPNRVS
jgi:hypothetical protein